MTKQAKLLMYISLIDSMLGSWLRIWWIKVFAVLLTSKVLSLDGFIKSLLGIAIVSFVIKKCEVPKLWHIIAIGLASYVSLFALYWSPSCFIIVSAVCGTIFSAFANAFNYAIYAQNIEQKERNKFDNRVDLMCYVGGVIGTALAFVTILKDVPYWIIWIAVYILFDIDLYVKIFCIKTGFLKYDYGGNNEVQSS
jgi:hypothetical protein